MSVRRLAALVATILMVAGLACATPAGADADQCAPPGVDSASALPTNLAAAAQGPGADKYTTATVKPLNIVDVNTLGLGVPGSRWASPRWA
jgi:polar amino acid transport system substrate-binding protein